MDLTGQLTRVERDYKTRKPMMTFTVNEDIGDPATLTGMLSIRVTKRVKPRSLDSNKYFHVLCDKLRQCLGLSMAEMKNRLITSYGQILYVDDTAACIKTNIAPEAAKEMEEPHLKYLMQSDDGAYWYRIYRGSHTYSTEEMHKLIEGTVFEAKEQGIETATPDQLKEMEVLWERALKRRKAMHEKCS